MKNKIWLITGISSGLGKALAESVIEKGDFVIGTFRKESQVEEFNKKHTNNAKAVVLDITKENGIKNCIDKIISDYGKIDVLVNNAGVGFVGAVEETSMEEVRSVFEPNFFGTLKMTQTVLPFMRKEKKGHIIQISSHGGVKAFAGFGIYNASKFALEGFSEAMAQEVAPLGIKVSIVEPGPFRTNFAGTGLGQAESVIDDYSETAGAFRIKLKGVNGKQEGDPIKASKAIINLTNSKDSTLRLPLGKVALMTIGMKLDSVKSDLEKNREIAESAVYD
ncbi:SDR family NAD(P)-dependent oxidoreductase [Aquimarina sp. BL5]|uniref:oxidoreductase n=1 Tax=Aquimarina sp. BL5 TaxID=1714860 RepID=UPI000E50E630|nr:oxidoreductase [Aquimarina sp. BL5]AXT50077.1 SDR family NAD(P)-dependent oxidoreductase [Aquimarina sp. BL5]RKM95150.1 SDR family NAD(P)-dependent oxidoreductase [Aquimarina sp. BL5]